MKTILRNIYLAYKSTHKLNDMATIFLALSKLQFLRIFPMRSNSAKIKYFNQSLYAGNFQTLEYLIIETFLSNQYFFRSNDKVPVIIDCGASIGDTALYFKSIYPKAKILTFEPDPESYNFLKQNISANQLKDVETYNVALSSKAGTIPFYPEEGAGVLLSSTIKGRGGHKRIEVKSQKLSSYIKKLQKIDLIKIDVEGGEVDIINDLVSTNTLTKCPHYIIEYHHNLPGEGNKLSSFLKHFENSGYQSSLKAGYQKVSGYQDILIHFTR